MGIFDFVKEAGAKMFKGDELEAKQEAAKAASLAGAVLQEEVLLALLDGDVPRIKELTGKYRTTLQKQRRTISRLSVIAGLHRIYTLVVIEERFVLT